MVKYEGETGHKADVLTELTLGQVSCCYSCCPASTIDANSAFVCLSSVQNCVLMWAPGSDER